MKKRITVLILFVFVMFGIASIKAEITHASSVTTNLNPWEVVDCWDGFKEWVNDGAQITLPGGVVDAWNRRADVLNNDTYGPLFGITDEKIISMKLKIGLFDNGGSIISKSNNSSALDIYVMNKANNQEIMLLRIWTDSGSWNNGNHSYEIYPIYGDWSTKIVGSNWIKGDATLDSEFFIQFSKDNLFESFIGGSEDITRLDDASNNLLNYTDRLNGIDQVYFRIAGDNGFSADTKIIITEINSQDLSNDGIIFNDNISPLIKDNNVSLSIPQNSLYTIPSIGYDLLSNNISYRIENEDGTIINPNGSSFTPTEVGVKDVVLVVSDGAGNETKKTYSFNIISNILPPVLTNVPILTDLNVNYFDVIEFPTPTIEEETGVYTLTLNIFKGNKIETEPNLKISDIVDNVFKMNIPASFESGDYTITFEATNEGGTIISSPQTISINVGQIYNDTFITPNNDYGIADYVNDGVRLRNSDYTWFKLGTFNMDYGFDIKYLVPESSNYLTNDALKGYVEIILADSSNPELHIMYRVWVGVSGPDNPTNIYIKYPEANYIDLTDSGWITKTSDNVKNQFHMAFDTENYFIGERTSGMVNADKGQTEIAQFLETVNSSYLTAYISSCSLGDKNYFEINVTEVNGQVITSNNGVVDQIKDPKLIIEEVTSISLINQEITLDVYLSDLFNPDITYSAIIIDPNNFETQIDNLEGNFSFTPQLLGAYKIKFKTTGFNQQTVESDEINLIIKDKITSPIIILKDEYNTSYNQNEKIKIIEAEYSSDINELSKVIKVIKPDGTELVVTANSDFTFAKPGIYTILYLGADKALPESNKVELSVSINIPDEEKPVVTIDDMPKNIKINDKLTIPNINVSDASTYNISVVAIKPDGTKINVDNNEIIPDIIGDWQIVIKVTDLYDNETILNYNIQVTEKAKNNMGLIILVSSIVLVSTVGAIVVLKKVKK